MGWIEPYCWLIVMVSTGLVGLLAMWVTFKPPPPSAHGIWMGVFAVLTFCGIGAAVMDRNASERDKAKRDEVAITTQAALRSSMDDLRRASTETARIQALNTQLQERLLAASSSITTLSKNILDNITGGDSYAYVTPQEHTFTAAGGMPLSIRNGGRYILTDVSVKFMRTTTDESFSHDAISGPEIDVGTLYPGEVRLIRGALITPQMGPEGIDSYWLEISAQNGLISETLSFRPRTDGKSLPWAYSFVVSRVTFQFHPKTISTTTPFLIRGWSDEPKK